MEKMMAEQDPALLTLWTEAKTEKEKATIEEEIWLQMKTPDRSRREELGKVLGDPVNNIENRATLFNAGGDADVFWKLIDSKQMSLSTSVGLMREAKALSRRNKITRFEAIQKAIELYNSKPFVAMVNGVPHRRGWPKKEPVVVQPTKKPDEIRQAVEKLLKAELEDVYPPEAGAARISVMVDLDSFLSGLKKRVSQAKSKTQAQKGASALLKAAASRTEDVKKACEVLQLDVPKGLKVTPEFLKEASTQKKRMARAYHPDTRPGVPTEESQALYQSLFEAYDLLEEIYENGKPT